MGDRAAASFSRRFVAWLELHRWPVVLFAAALAVRLHWNLVVHPLDDYVYSDMRGYLDRANTIFEDPFSVDEYAAFYPYGTHFLVFMLKAVSVALGLGRDGFGVIAIAYALMGAGVVWASYAFCRRMSAQRWVAPALGCVLVAYYPLISLGGYVLSEVPFALCLAVGTALLFRLLDEPSNRRAWVLGGVVAVGFTLRPQILMSVGILGVLALLYRRSVPRLELRLLLRMALPLILVASFSAVRLGYHTGRVGLIAENGALNRVLGHCHAIGVRSLPDRPDRRSVKFFPPPHIELAERTRRRPDAWVRLEPAVASELSWRGHIGDRRALKALLRRCHRATGPVGQLKLRAVNLILLSRYNTMWPDSGAHPWRSAAKWWGEKHADFVVPLALVALASLLRPRTWWRQALVAGHLLALMAVAALFLGGTRLRTPYDPFSLALALEALAVISASLVRRLRTVRNPAGPSPV